MKSGILKRNSFLLIGILMLAAVAARAQQSSANPRFVRWDKDRNQKLTHAEFYEGMKTAGVFEAWDRNGDKLLDRQEVYAGRTRMQQLAEKRREGRDAGVAAGESTEVAALPVQEGRFSYRSGATGETSFSFREVDLNRDGTLDKTEFFTALFRLWDTESNGFLRSHELKDSLLKRWLLV